MLLSTQKAVLKILASESPFLPGLSIFVFYPKIRFFEIEDAFYDKIQNVAYSYSESWHTRDSAGAVDG
jgi:hypothetical protein